jgi:hypothetical protein
MRNLPGVDLRDLLIRPDGSVEAVETEHVSTT